MKCDGSSQWGYAVPEIRSIHACNIRDAALASNHAVRIELRQYSTLALLRTLL